MSEFDVIRRYFTRPAPHPELGAELGVGDDAALVRLAPGMELAVSTDMLVSGTHFFPDAAPRLLGAKALAVNISDMAAMAARPRWALLSLSLPTVDDVWLQAFSDGFFDMAGRHGVELIGGDTTRGPLNLCVTIMGEVPQGRALRRGGARVGDDIWVSGTVGDAALGLAHLQGRVRLPEADAAVATHRLHCPEPRVALGLALRGMATSAIDISDGLLADLGHIVECSGAGAELDCDALPLTPLLRSLLTGADSARALALHCALAGGDDYELCFTSPPAQRETVQKLSGALALQLTRIGTVVPGSGCVVHAADGSVIQITETGYDHFA